MAHREGAKVSEHEIMSAGASRRNYPVNCWYVAATSDEVGEGLLGRRLLDVGIALYRTRTGAVVAFEDRCPHRGYPLSRGSLQGDNVVCGYHGFAFDSSGSCVQVPSQANVPYGVSLRMVPVRESPPYVWVWLGDPARAEFRAPEEVEWLSDGGVLVWGGELEVEANYMLLHENFADVTHVPFVHPEISPAVLRTAPPPLEIEVTETAVWYKRKYPAATLAHWHASATGLPPDGEYEELESGSFLSPALWVDAWQVFAPGGADGQTRSYSLRFAQAVTPVSPTSCRLIWRVGRDFVLDAAWVTASLRTMFTEYYGRVGRLAEEIQRSIDAAGPRLMFNVSADAAALRVRRIVANMLAEEAGAIALRSNSRSS